MYHQKCRFINRCYVKHASHVHSRIKYTYCFRFDTCSNFCILIFKPTPTCYFTKNTEIQITVVVLSGALLVPQNKFSSPFRSVTHLHYHLPPRVPPDTITHFQNPPRQDQITNDECIPLRSKSVWHMLKRFRSTDDSSDNDSGHDPDGTTDQPRSCYVESKFNEL